MWWPETPREGVAEPRGTDEGGVDEQGWALSPTAATVSSLWLVVYRKHRTQSLACR